MVTVTDAKHPPGPRGAATALAAPIGPPDAARTIGPFAMVAHAKMPASAPGALPVDADVRAHPHIGLTAITYLLDGAVTHRDTLGNRRELHAGDVGITMAGRGAVHSERFERVRLLGGSVEVVQLLLALPDGCEEAEPAFLYRPHDELPTTSAEGAHARWLLPAPPEVTPGLPWTTPILLADLTLETGARWSVPDAPERALYVREGEIEVGAARARAGQVAVVSPGEDAIRALSPARVLVLGGAAVGERHVWWNYIHSSRERIEAARAEWRQGRVKLPEGDTESFTPSPADDGRPWVRLNRS